MDIPGSVVLELLRSRTFPETFATGSRRSLDFVQQKTRIGPGPQSAWCTTVRESGRRAPPPFGLLTVPAAEGDAWLAVGRLFAEAIPLPPAANGRPVSGSAVSRGAPTRISPLSRLLSAATAPCFPSLVDAAYAQAYRLTRDHDHADFVFEMADWMLPRQYTGTNLPIRTTWAATRAAGCRAFRAQPLNEGVLEAFDLACQRAERERAASYQRAVPTAILFTLRLQFTRDTSLYVEHWERVCDGFCASLAGRHAANRSHSACPEQPAQRPNGISGPHE
jgi:hypothetical protein